MRLDFDFRGAAGYVIARRELPITFPENYQLSFRIRGEAPRNNLEVKLVDRSGDNVWWVNRRDFAFSPNWTTVTLKKRHITFAWGPAGGGELTESAAIEFAITAGTGGTGSVWIDDLILTPLPAPGPYTRTPAATARSSVGGHEPQRAVDGKRETSWRSRVNSGPIRPAADRSAFWLNF